MITKMGVPIPITQGTLTAALINVAPGIIIKYIGSALSGTCTVTATSSDLTFMHDLAVPGTTAVDSSVGASGVVAVATYTTMGAVVDEINSSSNWRAVLSCCRRADASSGFALTAGIAAAECKLPGGYGVLTDTTVLGSTGVTIGNKDVDGNTDRGRQYGFDRVVITATNAATTAASMLVNLYARNHDTGDESLLYTGTYVTATLLQMDSSDWGIETLWGKENESLLVQIVEGAGGTPDVTAAQIDIVGRYMIVGAGKVSTFDLSDL